MSSRGVDELTYMWAFVFQFVAGVNFVAYSELLSLMLDIIDMQSKSFFQGIFIKKPKLNKKVVIF